VLFRSQLVGTSSAANPITVKNTGNSALVFQVAIGGSNAGDFSEADACGGSVASGASCNLMITFAPKAPGNRTGMLIVTQINGFVPNSQNTVPLGGTAIDFSLGAANGSSTSASVVAGQAAAFNLQVTPMNGFAGAVALACSGAPASASCSPTPPSINVTGNSVVPFTLNIATSAAQLGIPLEKPGSPLIPPNWLLLVWLASFLSLFTRPRRRRFSLGVFAPVAALVLLLMATGCGGGATSATNSSAPQGTFTIVVTGTSQGTSRTVSLSLIIQ
jgi:hypothetical protein